MFHLHERLAADTVPVASLGLCRLLLMDNRIWPWLILVPERPGLTEMHQLPQPDQHRLMDEIARASRLVEELFSPDKINVGALGNVVSQLHVHVIGRTRADPAWPGPVWGSGFAESYGAEEREAVLSRLRGAIGA
ncbi:HIT family protein [Azospirillum sp. SYSU D00513]|uniref:HIT domain-containing protein n=1 Tax=Azospirillum sp. SYSU D00513 TaxID=2812561 RepID=UPI001A9745E9|nr:HIT family protein [Azospirillum sp. SYSU D00513]